MATKKRLTAKARGKRAFKLGGSRFRALQKIELKKFEDKYGYYPSGYSTAPKDWIGINKRAGAAYRRKYH